MTIWLHNGRHNFAKRGSMGLAGLEAAPCDVRYYNYRPSRAWSNDVMKIHNAVIITDAGSELRMTPKEQIDFAGNVIFSRDKLSSALAKELDRETGHSNKDDAAAPDLRRPAVKQELIR